MADRLLFRPMVETVLAAVSFLLALLTLADPEWIERVFGIEPDAGSGMAEWIVVALFALAAISVGILAARDWRRFAAARQS